MRKVIGLALFLLGLLASFPSHAQQWTQVSVCGTPPRTLPVGAVAWIGVDTNGNMCISGTISTTVTFPTVGAAVPSTAIYNAINVGGTLRGVTGLSLGSTYSQTMAIVDGSGNQITSFGGATTIADGADVAEGATADAAATAGSTGTVSAKLRLMTSQLGTIATNTGAAVPTTQSGVTTALISCDSHVFKHITSATDTLAVQGVTAKTIYVCGWRSRAAGVATWYLENTASTNANCSSSNTQITGVATEAANTGEVMNPAFWSGLKNTSGNGLCINSTGTGGVDIDIFYTQF